MAFIKTLHRPHANVPVIVPLSSLKLNLILIQIQSATKQLQLNHITLSKAYAHYFYLIGVVG